MIHRWLLAAILAGLALPAAAEEARQPTAPPHAPTVACGDFPNMGGFTAAEKAEINRQARIWEARYCAARKDILGWGMAIFPDKFHVPFCLELHQYLVDIRHEPFASTEAPRNHAKTTIECFLIPAFQALEEPETFDHYLNVQATDEKALAVNQTIKTEFEENELLRAMYGDVRGARWTNSQFVVRVRGNDGAVHEIVFTAKSAGQSIRGINYNSKRPCYIIVDDLYNEEDLNNAESTEKKNAWFDGALMYARAKTRRCCVHLLGTAINLYDKLEKNKKNAKLGPHTDVPDAKPTGRWVCKTFKAIKDMGQKVVLWPELNTFDDLMADQIDHGSIIFYREMQNERWDEATSIVKRSWLTSWEYDPAAVILGPRERRLVGVLLGCDPSIGKNQENDDTAIVVIWKTLWQDSKASEYWIDSALSKHLSLNERVLLLQAIADKQPEGKKIGKAILEAVGGFQDFGAEAKRRTTLPITTVEKVKDKISNLMNKSVHFETGRVHLNKHIDAATKEQIVYQLTTNYPKHDDLRDAILLCLDSNAASMWDRLG